MSVAISIPYRNPYFEVYLETGKKKKDRLDITEYISELHVLRSIEKTDTVTFKGQDRIENFKLLDNPFLRKGGLIYYRYGYAAWRMSSLRVCQITEETPEFDLTPEIVITCSDLGVPMKKLGQSRIFYNKTASEIANIICKGYGLKLFIEKTTKKYKAVATGNRTDFQFLKYLASREAGDFQAYLTGDEFYFYHKKNGTKSVVTFAYGDYEMFRFNVRIETETAKADEKKSKVLAVDKRNGKVTARMIDAQDVNQYKLGADYVSVFDPESKTFEKLTATMDIKAQKANGRLEQLTSTYIGKDLTDDKTMKELADKQAKVVKEEFGASTIYAPNDDVEWTAKKAKNKHAKEKKKIITGDLSAQLNPLITLDDVITVENVQKRFSGNWFVWEIEDIINSNGGVTNLKVGRNHLNPPSTKDVDKKTNSSRGKKPLEETAKEPVPFYYEIRGGKVVSATPPIVTPSVVPYKNKK